MASKRAVTAKVQVAIGDLLDTAGCKPDERPAAVLAAGEQYRNGATVADAVAKVLGGGGAATNTPKASKASKASPNAAVVAKAAKAAKANAATKAAQPKAAKVQPQAPEWFETGEAVHGFVRYARRLRTNGQAVSEYNLAQANPKRPLDMAIVQALATLGEAGPFVVYNHSTNQHASFDSHALAYAYTCAMVSTNIAPSVVGSIGGADVLARLAKVAGRKLALREQAETVASA